MWTTKEDMKLPTSSLISFMKWPELCKEQLVELTSLII
jgi:hypothetical protein